MGKVYYDKDGDINVVRDKVVAIIGYGNQGRSQALNMRDSGVQNIIVGSIHDASWNTANEDGFHTYSIAEAAKKADILFLLLPDEVAPEIYERDIAPNLHPGAALNFASGYNITYGFIKPAADLDVIMVAPRMIGKGVRETYENGTGFPTFLVVNQDATGHAKEIALGLAKALGSTKAGAIEVTFNDEESDAGTETVVEAPVDLHASRAVFYWKPKKVKGKKVDIGLDWESTLLSLGGDLSREFRKEVSRRAFERCEKEEGIAIWGDDIRGLDGAELIKHLGIERGDLDCYEGSPPCFPAGTMVLCQDRIRPIEEVEVGHVVLTHKGNWKRVTNTMTRQSDTLILDGGRIEATPDHPFYARRYSNPGNQKNTLESPEWIHAENMEGMFYSVPTAAPSSELPKMPELSQDVDPVAFWRFVGRWLGDG